MLLEGILGISEDSKPPWFSSPADVISCLCFVTLSGIYAEPVVAGVTQCSPVCHEPCGADGAFNWLLL